MIFKSSSIGKIPSNLITLSRNFFARVKSSRSLRPDFLQPDEIVCRDRVRLAPQVVEEDQPSDAEHAQAGDQAVAVVHV